MSFAFPFVCCGSLRQVRLSLVARVPLVTTDIDWDPGDILRETGCGVAVGSHGSEAEIAAAVIGWFDTGTSAAAGATNPATERLLRDRWVALLVEELSAL